jgi:hypothetical protein
LLQISFWGKEKNHRFLIIRRFENDRLWIKKLGPDYVGFGQLRVLLVDGLVFFGEWGISDSLGEWTGTLDWGRKRVICSH